MPLGTETQSAEEYVTAWRRLSEPIEAAFGFHIIGYDPGLLVGNIRHSGRRSTLDLPVWFALDLYKLLTGRDFVEVEAPPQRFTSVP